VKIALADKADAALVSLASWIGASAATIVAAR
jgi:hypothetical protein